MVDETNDQLKNKKAKQQAKKNKVIKTTSVEEVVFESSDLSIVRYVLSDMYCR